MPLVRIRDGFTFKQPDGSTLGPGDTFECPDDLLAVHEGRVELVEPDQPETQQSASLGDEVGHNDQ